MSALISTRRARPRASWVDEAVAGGRRDRSPAARSREDGVLAPTVLSDVTPDMKVCSPTRCSARSSASQTYTDLDDALRLANDTRYGLQAAIFTADLADALRAARTLDFGGVLVNEVPTFRADQQPYGGVRDSGNTREGPHYAVREMTEERLVIIQRDERHAEIRSTGDYHGPAWPDPDREPRTPAPATRSAP